MLEFTEQQQTEIRLLAQAAFKGALDDQAQLKDTGTKLVAAGLPVLSKVEKWLGNLWSVAGIVVAMPLAYFGLQQLADQHIQKGLETKVSQKLDDEKGPLKSRLLQFANFKGDLSNRFANNVDSATTKLLRFGCSAAAGRQPVDVFAPCPSGAVSAELNQARAVQETHDQMLLFKAEPGKQRVLLRLALQSIDVTPQLQHIALRLESPALLSDGSAGKRIELKATDLPDTHEFVTATGQLRLYGTVASRGNSEPLMVDIDITPHLRTKADVHALRFRAEPANGPQSAGVRGNERFFLHAIVVVTHNLPKD